MSAVQIALILIVIYLIYRQMQQQPKKEGFCSACGASR